MPLRINQVEFPTQPKPYSTAPSTDFPQVTAHASGHIATNSWLRPQPLELPASSAPVSQSAATPPIESCPLLAMRFLPTDFHLDPHQASTVHSYPVASAHHYPQTKPFALPTPLSPSPPPLPLCLPLSGQRQQPQTEHSGGPLGDPSARVFEVFLIVSQSVTTRCAA